MNTLFERTRWDPYMATKVLLISPESSRCTCGGGIPQCVAMVTEDRWRRILRYGETHQLWYHEETRRPDHECKLQVDLNKLMRKCKLIEHTGHASCLLFDSVKNKQFINAVETAIARDLVGGNPAPVAKPAAAIGPAAPVAIPLVLPTYLPGKFPNKLIWFLDMYVADPTFAARHQTAEWAKEADDDPALSSIKKPQTKLRKTARFIWTKLQKSPARLTRYLAEYNIAKRAAMPTAKPPTKPAPIVDIYDVPVVEKPPSESDSDDGDGDDYVEPGRSQLEMNNESDTDD